MKKIFKVWTLLFFVVFVLSACSTHSPHQDEKLAFKSKIPYEIYFQGFIVHKFNQEPPKKIIVFTNQKDWESFSEQYVYQGERVASMEHQIDWNKEDLIYYATGGAKVDYVGTSGNFLGYKIIDHHLEVEFDNQPQKKQTLAVNNIGETSGITISQHIWTIVKKENVPKGIKDLY